MAVETSTPYRRVVGTLIRGVGDGLLGTPSGIPLAGAKVVAEASIRSATSDHYIAFDPVEGITDNNAVLRNAITGEPGLLLVVTDDPAVGVVDWTWHITITAPTLTRPLEFDMPVPAGDGDLDLSGLDPIPGSDGQVLYVWRDAVAAEAAEALAAAISDADIVLGDDARLVKDPDALLRHKAATSSEYALTFKSEDGRAWLVVHPDNTVEIFKLKGVHSDASTTSSRWVIANSGDSTTKGFSGGGDWPNAESWPGMLSVKNPRAQVVNLGFSGATTDEISLNLGAFPLVAQAAVSVPASGTVAFEVQAGVAWRPTKVWSIHGKLGTVPGTLTRDANSATTMGFAADPGRGGVTVPALSEFRADPTYEFATIVHGSGRNELNLSLKGPHATVAEHTIAETVRIVEWMKAKRKRFLLWGLYNATDEIRGSARYNSVLAVNNALKARYPEHFIDLRGFLVNEAIYAAGLTPTATDLTAMGNDAPPPQVMAAGDVIHPGKIVSAALATFIDRQLELRDWKA